MDCGRHLLQPAVDVVAGLFQRFLRCFALPCLVQCHCQRRCDDTLSSPRPCIGLLESIDGFVEVSCSHMRQSCCVIHRFAGHKSIFLIWCRIARSMFLRPLVSWSSALSVTLFIRRTSKGPAGRAGTPRPVQRISRWPTTWWSIRWWSTRSWMAWRGRAVKRWIRSVMG